MSGPIKMGTLGLFMGPSGGIGKKVAMKRAARYGDGWIPYMYTPEQLADSVEQSIKAGHETTDVPASPLGTVGIIVAIFVASVFLGMMFRQMQPKVDTDGIGYGGAIICLRHLAANVDRESISGPPLRPRPFRLALRGLVL